MPPPLVVGRRGWSCASSPPGSDGARDATAAVLASHKYRATRVRAVQRSTTEFVSVASMLGQQGPHLRDVGWTPTEAGEGGQRAPESSAGDPTRQRAKERATTYYTQLGYVRSTLYAYSGTCTCALLLVLLCLAGLLAHWASSPCESNLRHSKALEGVVFDPRAPHGLRAHEPAAAARQTSDGTSIAQSGPKNVTPAEKGSALSMTSSRALNSTAAVLSAAKHERGETSLSSDVLILTMWDPNWRMLTGLDMLLGSFRQANDNASGKSANQRADIVLLALKRLPSRVRELLAWYDVNLYVPSASDALRRYKADGRDKVGGRATEQYPISLRYSGLSVLYRSFAGDQDSRQCDQASAGASLAAKRWRRAVQALCST
eukprot:scaffold1594_cov401-Prasinococcus_capsulatus_cf.AAC.26